MGMKGLTLASKATMAAGELVEIVRSVFWAGRRLRIPPGLSGEQAVWALAHQPHHRHTSRLLHGGPAPVLQARPGPAAQAARPVTGQQGTPSRAPQADGAIGQILADAHAFYTGQIAGSWAPGYLHARGLTAAAIADWRIGCAPAGWNALTSHLRRLGHDDDAIQAAGLATRSSRGTLRTPVGPSCHRPCAVICRWHGSCGVSAMENLASSCCLTVQRHAVNASKCQQCGH
jgi:DNA primase-like protein